MISFNLIYDSLCHLRWYWSAIYSHLAHRLSSLEYQVASRERYGPDALGKFFVYFAKKSVTSCLRQVRPVNFRSTKFCQSLPNFKDVIVLPRSRTNFCHAWNLTDLLIYTPWFEGKCQSRKFDLYFLSEIEVRSSLKLFLKAERCSRTRWSLRWHSRSSDCFCWS